jgi:hypothetical protein
VQDLITGSAVIVMTAANELLETAHIKQRTTTRGPLLQQRSPIDIDQTDEAKSPLIHAVKSLNCFDDGPKSSKRLGGFARRAYI